MSPERTPSTPTILVVDDSAADRRLAGGLLERAGGLRLEYAANGQEALDHIQSSVPDVAVTDLIMPEMDGLAFVSAVRAEFPLVPVVLMTARGNEEIAVSALRAGAAAYVPKRILAQDLAPTVKRVLAAANEDRSLSRLMHRMIHNESSFELHNDPSLIPLLLGYLQQATRCVHLEDELDRLRIRLAVEEALLNAVFRGNLEVSPQLEQTDRAAFDDLVAQRLAESPYRERRVRVSWSIGRNQLTVLVRDDGAGFDPTATANRVENVDFDTIFGRGLLIMRTFMDEVKYNATGNEVTLVKRTRPVTDAEVLDVED